MWPLPILEMIIIIFENTIIMQSINTEKKDQVKSKKFCRFGQERLTYVCPFHLLSASRVSDT